jgi:hypothetical protein
VTLFGFSKVAGQWSLSVRDIRYGRHLEEDHEGFAHWTDWQEEDEEPHVTKLQDASRDIRIRALQSLPLLIYQLKSRADEDVRAIVEAKKLLG